MTEHEKPSAEYIARAAVADYAGLGAELNFGEVEIGALDDWIAETRRHHSVLSATEKTHVAWMHIERCWSRLVEKGELGSNPSMETLFQNSNDLAMAQNLFRLAEPSADKFLQSHINAAITNHPIIKLAMLQPDKGTQPDPRVILGNYLIAQMENNEQLLEAFSQEGTLHDIPRIDAALGLRLLCGPFLIKPSHLPLVPALRHSQSGPLAERWHFALFNWETNHFYKMRIAPYGPSNMILLPPSLFRHADIPTKHGRGMLEAVAYYDALQRGKNQLGSKPIPYARTQGHTPHVEALFRRVGKHLTNEMARVNSVETYSPPHDPIAWFEQLPPFADPGHKEYANALELAISHLELMRINDEGTTESDYLLGNMYLDAGLSLNTQKRSDRRSLIGGYERAEDIFASARDALPQAEHQTSRYFELAIGEVNAQMHHAITNQEATPEKIGTYCKQLAVLAPQILEAYGHQADKTSVEALALHYLIQQVTICLTVSSSDDKRALALPSLPRQRGGINNTARGWDFSIWVYDSPDTYEPGPFYGRIEHEEDFYSIDDGVVTVTPKRLGLNNFKTTTSLLNIIDPENNPGRPDHKAIRNTRNRLLAIAYG